MAVGTPPSMAAATSRVPNNLSQADEGLPGGVEYQDEDQHL